MLRTKRLEHFLPLHPVHKNKEGGEGGWGISTLEVYRGKKRKEKENIDFA